MSYEGEALVLGLPVEGSAIFAHAASKALKAIEDVEIP
jgi:hypothetical protein